MSNTIFDARLCHTPSLTHHLSHATLSPTIFDTPSFTHNFVTHHLLRTTLSQTIFHRPSFTDHLSHTHTTLSHTIFHHTIFHTQLCHTTSFATPSFTHHFVTHYLSHTTLSHALFHTQLSHQLSHTTLSHTHTIFLCHTPSFTYNLVTRNFVLLLGPPPPPLSFLPSPSPLQHLVLIIGRSCLVGLSGPLIILYLKNEFFKLTEGYTPRPVSYTHSFNAKRVFACILFCSYPCFSFSFDACAFVGTMIALNLAIHGGILLFKSNFLH